MTRWNASDRRSRRLVVTLFVLGSWISLTLSSTSSAVVTAVKGEAYGFFGSVSLFGGPPMTRGPHRS